MLFRSKGQCIRSNAGLYYEGQAEFVETLRAIECNRWIAASLGRNGRQYYRDHYDWPVIERKYLDMLRQLSATPDAPGFEALPGWMARRTPACPPAAQVVAAAPAGPVAAPEMSAPRPSGPLSPPMPRRAHVPPPARSEGPSHKGRRSDGRGRRPPGRRGAASR